MLLNKEEEFRIFDCIERGNNEKLFRKFQVTKNVLLTKRKVDKTDEERYITYSKTDRKQIKSVCHDATPVHIGITKSKACNTFSGRTVSKNS